jgi:uncharacterized zinc-type alcohol dehydrogenase-like protein
MVENTFEHLGDRAPTLVDISEADGIALGFETPTSDLTQFAFKHPSMLPHELRCKVLKSGLCHSNAHKARFEWGSPTYFPMVPGHEVAGVVTEMGDGVRGFEIGDRVGFGPYNASCGTCESCL